MSNIFDKFPRQVFLPFANKRDKERFTINREVGAKKALAGPANYSIELTEYVQYAIDNGWVTVSGGGGGGSVSTDGTLTGNGTPGLPLSLANNSVSTAKIVNGAVTTSKLGDNSVSTAKIQNQAVTLTKIVDAPAPGTDAAVFLGRYDTGSGVHQYLKLSNSFFTVSPTGVVSLINVGEVNTASNVGLGVAIYKEKVGVDFRFKTLIGGTNVNISQTANEVTITASGGGGGSDPVLYDAGNGGFVLATGVGITFTKNAGVGTFTVPNGVRILSARVHGTTADLAANAFSVVFTGAGFWASTNETNLYPPSVTKYDRILEGLPSEALPYTYDIDNTPQIQLTAANRVRVINLNGVTNWGLKFQF